MVAPLIGAALIGGAASLAGGYMASRSARKQGSRAEDAFNRAIRTRVADAKAAGVHPLAAIGAPISGPAAGPSIGDYGVGAAVNNVMRAISLQGMKEQTRLIANQADYWGEKATNVGHDNMAKQSITERLGMPEQGSRPLAIRAYDPTSKWQGYWPDPEMFEALERFTSPGATSIPYFNRDNPSPLPWE
jgi:hypothetical protein